MITTYTHDTAGRLATVADASNGSFTYAYELNTSGLVKSVTGPAHTVNNIGQRTALTTTGTAFTTAPAYSWSYNAAGELVEADDTSTANNDRAYQFDAIGNREKTANGLLANLPATPNYVADAVNQYTKANGITLPVNAYDDDGNLTVAPLPKDQNTNVLYHWDAENRLVKITNLDETTTIAEYSYDYLGRRIAKQSTVNGQLTTVHWIYDGWNMIAEYTGTTLSKTYTWGMDLSGSMQGAGGVGGLLSVTEHVGAVKTHYYPTFDGNGNISEYLASNGTAVAHYEYDAFGNTTVATGTKKDDFAHRFSTKYHDPETGLYYYGYRYYDTAVGRWINRDPIGERGGLNLYGFVFNDGINKWDYLGLEFIFPWGNSGIHQTPVRRPIKQPKIGGPIPVCADGARKKEPTGNQRLKYLVDDDWETYDTGEWVYNSTWKRLAARGAPSNMKLPIIGKFRIIRIGWEYYDTYIRDLHQRHYQLWVASVEYITYCCDKNRWVRTGTLKQDEKVKWYTGRLRTGNELKNEYRGFFQTS